ncbi:MAG: response regulator [Deltaproteobacteria bacterium]|nr:response regulator [Deltaproteobacteria bacterium]
MIKILVVDDEDFLLESMCDFFQRRGYETYGASTGEEALAIVKRKRPHIVLLDLMLAPGGLNGFSVLKYIREADRTVKVIMITGMAMDAESARRAAELGVSDYLHKPVDFEKLEKEAIPKIGAQLFEDFRREADECRRLYEELKGDVIRTITALAKALDARDRYTYGHSERVAEYAEAIAREMGLPEQEISDIRIGGLLHDLGKIAMSDEVLRKPGRLTEEEYEEVKRHATDGARILSTIPRLGRVVDMVLHHHERYDGQGYPHGLNRAAIPQGAQVIALADTLDNVASCILAVSDSFDAMTSPRPYRAARTPREAVQEILRCRGTQFDPVVVDAFTKCWEKNGDDMITRRDPVDYRQFPVLLVAKDEEVLQEVAGAMGQDLDLVLASSPDEVEDALEDRPDIHLVVLLQEMHQSAYQRLVSASAKRHGLKTRIAVYPEENGFHGQQASEKFQGFRYLLSPGHPESLKMQIMATLEADIHRQGTPAARRDSASQLLEEGS